MRSLRRIARRVLSVAAGLLILGVIVFFGLTRTQVGRSALRDQVVHRFNERFRGRLAIDALTGNLARELTARGVRLYDTKNRLLVSVDSVTARPHWIALLQRRLSIKSLTLHRPSLHLQRGADGRWNLASAFERVRPRAADSTANPLRISALDLRILDGSVTTRNDGPAPRLVAQERLFDYTNARLQDLNAQLYLGSVDRSTLRFDLENFSARLTNPALRIENLTADAVLADGHFRLDDFRLETTGSQITGNGFAESLRAGPAAQPGSLTVNVQGRPLDLDEVHRLVPALPLRGTVRFQAEAGGTLADLNVRTLEIERGASVLRASGRVRGLPDEARFRLSFDENTLSPDDVAAVAPSMDTSTLQHIGRTQFSLGLRGETTPSPGGALHLRTTADIDIEARTEAGPVNGNVHLTRGNDRALTYEAELRTSGLDLGRLTGRSALQGQTRGTVTARGRLGDENAPDSSTKITVALQDTHLGVLGTDALDLDVTAQAGVVRGTAQLRQAQGALTARFRIDSTGRVPNYRLSATARNADLAPLLHADSVTTRLNGRFTLSGVGTKWTSAQGNARLQTDSSVVRYGEHERVVPGFEQQFRLTPLPPDEAANSSRLTVNGDVLTASLTGPLSPSFAKLGTYWLHKVRSAARRTYEKPYPGAGVDSTSAPASARSLEAPPGVHSARITGEIALKRPDVPASLLPPSAPHLPKGLSSDFDLTMRPDSVHVQLQGRADVLRRGPLALTRPRLRLRAAAGTAGALEHSLRAHLTLSSDTLRLGKEDVPSVAVTLQHRAGTSRMHLTSGGPDQPGPLQLAARLRQLPNRNRLTIQTLRLAAPGYAWAHAHSEPIDLYSDAIVVPDLALQNTDSTSRQYMALRGVLSSAPTDTLFLNARRVSLADISRWASLKRPIGGSVNGEVAFTGGRRAPELTGRLNAHQLSFDDRLLGNLSLKSRYEQPGTGITVQANLHPPENLNHPFPADSVTAGGLHIEPSRLQIAGSLRLPGAEDPGALDLRLDVQRADFFFLAYIFDQKITDVQGALQGDGRVTGPFRDPRIQADLRLAGGEFFIPRFHTRYTANGPLHVDSTGIHLNAVQLGDPTGGTARVQGALHLNDYEYLSFDLDASLDELRVVNVVTSDSLPFYGRIWGSGRFTLQGPLSGATLRSSEAVVTPKSEVYIPVKKNKADIDAGYIIFADSAGRIPNLRQRRENIFSDRPEGERKFTDGLQLDLNLIAQSGTTVHLVIDPLSGEQIDAVGSGRIQLQRSGGELRTYGTLEVSGGDYLFTAGELFFRRFRIQDGGTLRWTGPGGNPRLDLTASYRTRSSTNGLPDNLTADLPSYLPVVVLVNVSGRVQTPEVQLDLALDRDARDQSAAGYEGLEAYLNRSGRSTEYATSVLLTNSFLLTPSLTNQTGSELASTRRQIAFNSVSQLVASQLNRYLSEALPNFDLTLGLQGQSAENLGVTYGLALRLLDERLVIRGEGAYQNERTARRAQGLQGEFVVEVRLGPRVSAEAFYRREGDLLGADLTNTTGVGLSYETVFGSWRAFFERFFGWHERKR